MNKQYKLASQIVDKAFQTRNKFLNTGEYLAHEVPPRVFEMKWLTELRLNVMEFEELPSDIGNLSKLETLRINGNRLQSLPPTLGRLSAIKTLDARDNPLEGLPDPPRFPVEEKRFKINNINVVKFF